MDNASRNDVGSSNRLQYWVLAALSAAVLSATLVLVASGRSTFARFIGAVNPVRAVVAVSLILAAITPAGLLHLPF